MRSAFFKLHTAVFLAGFTGVLGRFISLQEAWLVWYRLLFTLLALGFLARMRKDVGLIPFRDMLRIFFIGFIVAAHWLAFYGSVKYSNASVAMVCLGCTGFFTAVFEPAISRSRWVWPELFFGLLSLAGIYIIFDFNPQFKTGILFGMIAVLGSSVFPVLNKKMLDVHEPRTVIFYEMAGAFIFISFLLPFYFHFFPAKQWLPSGYDLFWLLILAVLCTVVAMDLQFSALKKISAFTVNLTYSLEPAYGILMAFLFLGEGRFFETSFYAGLGLVVLSVGLHTVREFHALRAGRPDSGGGKPKMPENVHF